MQFCENKENTNVDCIQRKGVYARQRNIIIEAIDWGLLYHRIQLGLISLLNCESSHATPE